MLIYNYDPQSGAFTGASEADPSPLEPGKFLIPACAVTTPPPDVPQGSAAAYLGGQWVILMDRRGEVWFRVTGEAVLVDTLGDPALRGLRKDPPAAPLKVDAHGVPILSPRQIRLGLLKHGITSDVVTSKLVGDDYELIAWQYATQFIRSHWLVLKTAEALGLTPEQVDAMWTEASLL